jgi:hypothetical protein
MLRVIETQHISGLCDGLIATATRMRHAMPGPRSGRDATNFSWPLPVGQGHQLVHNLLQSSKPPFLIACSLYWFATLQL